MLHIEEQDSKTTVVLVGKEFPFIAELVAKRLEKRGCQVLTNNQKVFADYLIFLGPVRSLKQWLKRLKDGGKAVGIAHDTYVFTKRLAIETYVVSPGTSVTADVLARQILRKLFTAPATPNPWYLKEIEQKTPRRSNKFSIFNFPACAGRQFSFVKIVATVGIALIFIAIPFGVLIGSIGIAGFSLNAASQLELPREEREISIRRSVQTISFADKTYQLLEPMIRTISPDTNIQFKEIIAILNNTQIAAMTAITLEKLVSFEGKNIFKEESSILAERLPDMKNKLSSMDLSMQSAELSYKNLAVYKDQFPLRLIWPKLMTVPTLRKSIAQAKEAANLIPQLLAFNNERTYLLLLQNNFELRPTGGFIGSFGIITVKNGTITAFKIQDVYEADGQLKGRVEPPAPIAMYLNQPNWYLRDSNWNPDFSYSAAQAAWFLQKELNIYVDGVIAVDLYFVKNVLTATGPIFVPDFQASVTADDFFYKLQADTHDAFFPGSTKKKDLLTALTSSLLLALTERNNLSYGALLKAIQSSLENKHMLFYFHQPEMQITVERLNWAGRMFNTQTLPQSSETITDYIMLVDANVGVNKVNYYIKRELFLSLSVTETSVQQELTIHYRNESPSNQSLFSGTYKNYLRLFVPSDAAITSVHLNDEALDPQSVTLSSNLQDKKTIGFLMSIEPGKTVTVTTSYHLPIVKKNQFRYQLLIQKQPGTDADPLVFKLKDTGIWNAANNNIGSFPYLSSFTSDRLFAIDFQRNVE